MAKKIPDRAIQVLGGYGYEGETETPYFGPIICD